MSSAPPPEKQRRQRRSTTSSKNTEELLSPAEARKNIKKLLITAIDEIADTLKQIPRAQSPAAEKTSTTSTTTETRSELVPIDENRKRTTFGEKQPKKLNRKSRKALDSTTTTSRSTSPSQSVSTAAEQASECDCNGMPLPITHGVFDKEPIYCRDRYFKCRGKNMYTREIFAANGEPLKPNLKKLNQLRGVDESSAAAETSPPLPTTTVSATTRSKKSTTSGSKASTNTILIQNIKEDAKGVTLKFNIKMVKPDGTPKNIECEIEMPDFEPSFVKVGQKTAFLE